MSYQFVALGGGLCAMLRMFVNQLATFPFGAMSVNIIGSFVMGIAFVMIGPKAGSKEVLFLMIGILGGFTTSSALRWTHSSFGRRVKWDLRLAISH